MKKALVFLMCIVLTVCTVFTVSATNAPTAAVSASAAEVLCGEYFTVSVSVDGCTDIAALGVEITYDKELYFVEGKWNTAAFSAGNNTVTTQLGNFNYVDGRGVIAFEVKDSAQNVVEGAGVKISGTVAELKFLAEDLSDAANITVQVVPVGTDDQNVEVAPATTGIKVKKHFLTYTVEGGEATVTGCDSSIAGTLSVPSTIGGYPITKIGKYAFKYLYSVTEIVLPEGVKSIESYAIYNCTSLESITLPDSLESIGNAGLFGSWKLKTVHIPKNVSFIGDSAFDNAVEFEGFSVDADNKYFSAVDGVLYDADAKKLIRYPVKKDSDTFVAPSTVEIIGNKALYDCRNLKSIVLPEGVISIDDYALQDCANLESLYLPKTLKNIGIEIMLGVPPIDIYYAGSETEWQEFDIIPSDESFDGCTFHYNYGLNLKNGWQLEDNTWYYYENGVKVKNDWRIDSIGWCFLDEEGKWVIDAFVRDSHGLAYITADGYFYYDTNGWVNYKGEWYFLENGYMGTPGNGWHIIDNVWYYFENGEKVRNAWRQDSQGWCYLSETGAMVTNNFVNDSVGKAYITADGYFYYTEYGWRLIDGVWYYIEGGYAVMNQWRADSIGWCYLSETGAMVTNNFVNDSVGKAYITEDGYFYYTENGWRLVEDTWYYIEGGYAVTSQWRLDSIGWCYLGEDGKMYTSRWLKDSIGWCYIDENGYCLANGTYTVDGYEYTFDADGRIQGVPADFSGKKYVAFGDSITFGADYSNGYKQMANPYPKLVGGTLSFDSVDNQGVSGAFYCENDLNFRCMTKTILEYNGDADVISVMLGVNDWSRGMQLGTPTDKTKSTIYGCINLVAEHLTTKYPDAFIFFMTPYKALEKWNIAGHDMYELVDVANAVKEIAAKYDIPVLDMYNLGNYELEMNNVGNDGCHPSQEFMIEHAAPQVAEFIRANYNK